MNLKTCLHCILFVLAGCSSGIELNRENMIRHYEQQKEIFTTANFQAEGYYEDFMYNKDDYFKNLKDKNWDQIVSSVFNAMRETIQFIDEYEKGVKLEAGIEAGAVNYPDAFFDRKPSENYFIKKEKADAVFETLTFFRENIKKADAWVWDKMQKQMVLLSVKEDTGILKDKKNFIRHFENLTVLDACILLEQLKTNLVFNFRRLVYFCIEYTRRRHGGYESYRFIVGQNQTSFLPGEKLEITSGMGEFSNASLPSCTIGNKKMDSDESGVFFYKRKVPDKPGNYKTDVEISYTDQDGKRQVIIKTVEYKVTKPCDN